jgi:hypothetical protein
MIHHLLLLSALAAPPALPDYPDHANLETVRDGEGKLVPVASKADWGVRRDHVLGGMQQAMGPIPGPERRVPLDVRVLEETDQGDFLRRKIDFASEPGDRVPAWLLIPKRPGPLPAVLALHQTVAIGKDEPAGLGGKENLHYGLELARRGYVVLIPDYPRFGDYKVDVYALGYQSASMKAIWNNMRGVDLLADLPRVDPERIGAIGHSLGGHNALFTAAFEPRIKAAVTSCGFTRFGRYYNGDLTGWSHAGYMPRIKEVYGADPKRMPFDFPEILGAIAPRGVFVNAPTKDDNFDLQGVKESLESARGVFGLHGVDDRLKGEYPEALHDFPPEQRESAYRFLDGLLRE